MSATTLRLGLGGFTRPAARPSWETAYAVALTAVDAVAVLAACLLAFTLRFGDDPQTFSAVGVSQSHVVSYSLLTLIMVPAWVVVLGASRAYEARFLGVGSEEFKRLLNASVRFVALIGFLSFALRAQLARGFVGVAVPAGVVLLLAGRFAARKLLHLLRRKDLCLHRVVAVGSVEEVTAITLQVQREPYAGLNVVAVALPDYDDREMSVGGRLLPNVGPARDMVPRLAGLRVDTVAVAGASALSSRELRQLSWDLERTGTDLLVAPAITDVTGPRIHVRPVAGLPLLHVEAPSFGGFRGLAKRLIDLVGALLLVIALALPFLVIALLIVLDDPGPVIYRQTRVGRDGSRFTIWKFRSMHVHADRMLDELSALNESDGPLFKLRQDPRVTRIGSFLRTYSLDELPQLFNVLGGSMSLVGPRPPLPTEVDVYDTHVHRRLLVKPGMTGLWQVSGRADLAWEESVRLDLYYVENWSVALDAQILWKTFFAVVRGGGAY